jgi:hypothetical protein
LVINADTASMRRIEAALSRKADAMRNADKITLAAKKADSSLVKANVADAPVDKTTAIPSSTDNTNALATTVDKPAATLPVTDKASNLTADADKSTVIAPPTGSPAIIAPPTGNPTIIAPPADGQIEVRNASGAMQVQDIGTPKTTVKTDSSLLAKADNTAAKDQNTAATTPVTDNTATKNQGTTTTTPATDNAATKDQGAVSTSPVTDGSGLVPSKNTDIAAKKPDSSPVTGTDSTLSKKLDTVLAKKDTSLVKRSDTTIVQRDSTKADSGVKAQSWYVEVGGAGLAISGNYDARFKKERNGWGYRVGVGFFASGGNNVFTVPFQINYLIGEHSHMLELGAGTTFLNSNGTNVGTSKFEFDKVTGFIGTATIGYRFQPEHKGINVRIAFVPILYDEGLIPAGGISVGYTFK